MIALSSWSQLEDLIYRLNNHSKENMNWIVDDKTLAEHATAFAFAMHLKSPHRTSEKLN